METLHGIEHRFWAKVRKFEGCWLWVGSSDRDGYGELWVPALGRTRKAHRLAYARYVGPIPAGSIVCHHCDNPSCVRPDHLFLGTHADNVADKLSKGRQTKGERHGPSKLTRAAVIEIRTSDLSRSELAAKHGVSIEAVSMAANGSTWAHVEAPTRDRRLRLTDDEVRAIRASDEPGIVLAGRYGVSTATISRTRNGTRRASV